MGISQTWGFECGDLTQMASGGSAYGTYEVSSSAYLNQYSMHFTNPTTSGAYSFGTYLGHASSTGTWDINAINLTAPYFSFNFMVGALPSGDVFFFRDNPGYYVCLKLTSTGTIKLYDYTPTLIGTSGVALTPGIWYLIEVYRTAAAAGSATLTLKINGVVEVTTSTGNTWGPTAYTNGMRLGKDNTVTDTIATDFYYDNVGIGSGDWLGQLYCTRRNVTSNGANQGWVIGAGSGSHYEIVDEAQSNGDTDYMRSPATVGVKESYLAQSCLSAGITGTILGAECIINERQDGSQPGTSGFVLQSSSSTVTRTGYTLSIAYVNFGYYALTDPATSVAWTVSGLEAAEWGAIDNHASRKTRMSWCFQEVASSGSPARPRGMLGVGM